MREPSRKSERSWQPRVGRLATWLRRSRSAPAATPSLRAIRGHREPSQFAVDLVILMDEEVEACYGRPSARSTPSGASTPSLARRLAASARATIRTAALRSLVPRPARLERVGERRRSRVLSRKGVYEQELAAADGLFVSRAVRAHLPVITRFRRADARLASVQVVDSLDRFYQCFP